MSSTGEEKTLVKQFKQFKLERGYEKAKVTKKLREVKDLMQDRTNVSLVNTHLKYFDVIVQNFKSAMKGTMGCYMMMKMCRLRTSIIGLQCMKFKCCVKRRQTGV